MKKDSIFDSLILPIEELYSKMRQGEKIPIEAAKDFIKNAFI